MHASRSTMTSTGVLLLLVSGCGTPTGPELLASSSESENTGSSGTTEGVGSTAETDMEATDESTGNSMDTSPDTDTESTETEEPSMCPGPCGNGICDEASGQCICEHGYHGQTCEELFSDCLAILEATPDAPDDFYMVDPVGGSPFEAWCDQTADGGGWMAVFKNHGGAHGGEVSNLVLLEGDPSGFQGAIGPHTVELKSGVNSTAWDYYKDRSQLEWLKVGTLWDANDFMVKQSSIRVIFGDVTWEWILNQKPGCQPASNPVSVIVDGMHYLGQTNQLLVGMSSFGLANDEHQGADTCGQLPSNLIRDPRDVLFRLDGGDSLNGIRHLFSYKHSSSDADASRCQFGCWIENNYGGYYDGFTWFVRPKR